jgi:hypothetical protein
MAKYRDKYILEGLDNIPDGMREDLDLAYEICKKLHDNGECAMCGKCCHQPNITVMDGEVERIAKRAGMEPSDFTAEYLYRKEDRWLLKKSGACRFLGADNKCAIWTERPEICRDFPYLVSKFMSRVYLSIVNPDHDIDLSYMEDDWPCTPVIKGSVRALIKDAREERENRVTRSP